MKRPWRWWVWLAGGGGLLAAFIAYQHLVPRRTLRDYKARLRAEGVPLAVDECLSPVLSAEVTAARRFAAAAQRLPNLDQTLRFGLSTMRMVEPGQARTAWRQPHAGYDTEASRSAAVMARRYGLKASGETEEPQAPRVMTWAEVSAELKVIAPLLQEIEEASLASGFNWNLDYSQGFNVLLPHLADCKRAVQWLTVATQAALHDQRWEEATGLIETQLRLVRNLEHDGLLIDELVRIAMAAIAWEATWAALQAEGLTDPHLARLQAAWDSFRPVEGMIEALRLERALGLYEYERCRKSARHMADLLGGVGAGLGAFGAGAAAPTGNFIEAAIEWLKETFASQHSLAACRWWGWFDSYEDEQCYIEVIQAMMEVAQRRTALGAEHPIPADGLRPGETWKASVMPRQEEAMERYLMANTVLFSLDNAMNKAFRVRMQRDMALTAIALRRHQLRHGQLPSDLSALTPEFLPAQPLDWMDGRPLRYRKLEHGGFLLYSVNDDGVDDHGDPNIANPRSANPTPYQGRDFVWPAEALPSLFTAGEFEAGFRLSSTNLAPETVRIVLHTNEPPVWITLLPWEDSPTNAPATERNIGQIEVSKGSPPSPIQALVVRGTDPRRVKSMFEVLDINFDGYADLLTGHETGANTLRRCLWLYDPATQGFGTNALTERLGEITHHSLSLDHESQSIRMTHFNGFCTNSWEIWQIREGQWLNLEAEVHVPEEDRYCRVRRLVRTQDSMRVTREYRTLCPTP